MHVSVVHTPYTDRGLANNKTQNNLYSRITVTFVVNTLGGWVETWHIYRPASSFSIGFMCKRQLFGYWNVTLNRGSPVCVTFPTDNNENLSTVRRTHITWPQNGTKMVNSFRFDLSVFPADSASTIPANGSERWNWNRKQVKKKLKWLEWNRCVAN